MAGKPDNKSRVKDEEAELPGQSLRGSRKNYHLVRSLAKRYKGVGNKSSSSSEDTDGYDSTSDSNTPSRSPSPPARKLKVTRQEGSEGLDNHSLTDPKVKSPEMSGQVTNVEDAFAKDNGTEKMEVSTSSKEGVVDVSDWGEEKINEEGEESYLCRRRNQCGGVPAWRVWVKEGGH